MAHREDMAADPWAALREEVRTWIAEHWNGTDDSGWRGALVEAGWAAPTWERSHYGRGLSRAQARVVKEEFEAAEAPGAGVDLEPFVSNSYLYLLGDTLRAHGDTRIRDELLPGLLSGRLRDGCLLYSEPGAGSDLAAVQTRADVDGDHYVVNGQKIWTSYARDAQFALLIARTNWDVVKHAGLSFFIVDMESPGIDVRPITQITGETDFNEVFLTDVRVPAVRMVGNPGDGWKVLQTALVAERAGMGAVASSRSSRPDESLAGAVHDLVEAARASGRDTDPVVRQEIAKNLSWRLTNTWTGQRAVLEGRRGSFDLANVGKLAMSRILHSGNDLKFRLQGRQSLVYDYDSPLDHRVDRDLMFGFINSIGGGSDQIQRNIISERVLGLPKGYEPDKGLPFRDVRQGGAVRVTRRGEGAARD